MAQILNNLIVLMAPHCAQKLCGVIFFDQKGKSGESGFKRIESKLVSIEILSLKVDSNELKVETKLISIDNLSYQ